MNKILYLHGLESTSAGKKAELLMNNFLVHAPVLNYFEPDVYSIIEKKAGSLTPDIIVGSSMGGYMAQVIATNYYHVNRLILINPALKSPIDTIDFPDVPTFQSEFTKENPPTVTNVDVILGEDDDVVNPRTTFDLFNSIQRENPWLKINVEVLEGVGHRVSQTQFETVLKKLGHLQ